MEYNGERPELLVEMAWHLLMFIREPPLPVWALSPLVFSTGKQLGGGDVDPPCPHLTPIWSRACRGAKANPDEASFLYTLPGASTHQRLQTHQDRHPLQEQPAPASQSGMRRGPQNPGLEATWDPLFHPGLCRGQSRKLTRLEVA